MLEISIFKVLDNAPIQEVYSNIEGVDIRSYEGLIVSISKNNALKYHELINKSNEKIILVYNVQSLFSKYHDALQVKVHEIKNLLTVVVSSSLLMLKIIKKGKIEEKMDFIKRSLGDVDISVQSIIVNLNGIKKLFSEEEKTYRVKVLDFITFFESELNSLCDQNKIANNFEIEISDEDMKKSIETKGIHINQVCINLLKNSIYALNKSNKPNKKVEILVNIFKNSIRMSITDNGDGIPDEIQDEIFESGFTTKGSEGSGLGLALCQKVMLESNGNIELDSSFDQGARFNLHLPF